MNEAVGVREAVHTGQLTLEECHQLPKVLLHDHLDGGLRPQTVFELAQDIGHALPANDVNALADWFDQGRHVGDLSSYLEAFDHTVALLQTPHALQRVARECAEDLDADGVIYAEVRYAPELSTKHGMDVSEVIEAIARGFADGPRTIVVRQLVCAMRHQVRSDEVFAAAAASRDLGVVGIDLAGPERGFAAQDHAAAITSAREAGLNVTLHAGEDDGVASISDALAQGAQRLGHGVRIADEVRADAFGPVATQVKNNQVALELCPTSNVHTSVVDSVANHPIERLRQAGFSVTVNTDNRLMSAVTASSELEVVSATHGWTRIEAQQVAENAASAAFVDEALRDQLLKQIDRGYRAAEP